MSDVSVEGQRAVFYSRGRVHLLVSLILQTIFSYAVQKGGVTCK